MKKLYLLGLWLIFLISACRSDVNEFNTMAAKLAGDGQLSAKDYDQLLQFAKSSTDRRFQNICYAARQFDQEKMNAYLVKLFDSKGLNISQNDLNVLNGKTSVSDPKFRIGVYLENSASMDGYVSGQTDFKDAIYSLLGEINLKNYCNGLDLNYINSKILLQKKAAGLNDIGNFIQTLTPATFRARGGNRSASDIQQLLDSVLAHTNAYQASMLISDFVFSPGKQINAQTYLIREALGIKMITANKLKAYDLSLLILQMDSRFNGFYYNAVDRPTYLKANRPYYIWIIANSAQMRALLKSGLPASIQGGYRNKLLLQAAPTLFRPKYKILYKEMVGNFRLKDGAQGPISNAEVSKLPRTAGKFSFKIGVDFSGSLQDNAFFCDSANYQKNSNYVLGLKLADPSAGYTHELTLTTGQLMTETIRLSVQQHLPAWVINSNSDDDFSIAVKPEELHKTFGLRPLIDALFKAFYPPGENNSLADLSIAVKK